MRKLGTALAALGLAVLGVAVPTSAQAAPQGAYCDYEWNQHGRDGLVRAWNGYDCTGTLLGATPGDDYAWGDSSGAFTGTEYAQPKSVMNSGYVGNLDVVAFYRTSGYRYEYGYVCLSPYELYADDLSDNYYTNNGGLVLNNIGSHRWVNASGCAANSWLT
ncbi:hypothetical protein [Streptomyces sp. CB03238]|uniref:hypothetical protein n=1 Tax=Streptomyces sp. CB03238 TaxID=1907777 RepID=UPI000A117AA5|nr:hypothetical protein [Streptomyces sp. CB03238]ORT53962.1 hypothetical protein BKD26_36820 [Streptomyces sp. CB03238]